MATIYHKSCPVFVEAGEICVTSPFGWRVNPVTGYGEGHKGVDITRWIGYSALATICSFEDGTVIKTGYDYSRGYNVSVDHGGGWVSMYFHLADGSIRVKAGDNVKKRQNIGYMGSTGQSTGAHLHFQLELNGTPVDGLPYLLGEETIGDDAVTYEQFCEYMARYEKEKAQEPASPWAEESLAWANRNGILRGDEHGNLMPQSNLTREQMAVMLNRYAEM